MLANFIEQPTIADIQKSGCLFAVPPSCFQSPRDGIDLGFIFQRAQRRFHSGLPVHSPSDGNALEVGGVGPEECIHGELVVLPVGSKFGYRCRLVAHD